jgi:hypothetical protein
MIIVYILRTGSDLHWATGSWNDTGAGKTSEQIQNKLLPGLESSNAISRPSSLDPDKAAAEFAQPGSISTVRMLTHDSI